LAIEDAYYRYLLKWSNSPKWLFINQTKSIFKCHEQRYAAWAALEALQWNNNNGVNCNLKTNLNLKKINIAFGPSCDYLVATIMRILSYKQIPMITNSHARFFLFFFYFNYFFLFKVNFLKKIKIQLY
jgi:hypothetical protein